MTWRPFREVFGDEGRSARGAVLVWPGFDSASLGDRRDIFACLSPAAAAGQRVPVVYMQDGQNLFDERLSHAGEWRVDETLEELAPEGRGCIVVGPANGGERRAREYNAFDDASGGSGLGDAYLRFLVHEVKPLVDASFPTRPGRETTGIAGSSYGAAIALYAFFREPATFGFAGALSLAGGWGGDALLRYIEDAPRVAGRIHLDVGTREAADDERASRSYLEAVRRYRGVLVAKGYAEGSDLRYVEDEGATHHERAWSRRLPDVLRFLLPSRDAGPVTPDARTPR